MILLWAVLTEALPADGLTPKIRLNFCLLIFCSNPALE